MKAHPVEYQGKTYYPTKRKSCVGCAYDYTPEGCRAFTKFIKANTGLTSSCTQGCIDVIWQVGGVARLQYITERLTT